MSNCYCHPGSAGGYPHPLAEINLAPATRSNSTDPLNPRRAFLGNRLSRILFCSLALAKNIAGAGHGAINWISSFRRLGLRLLLDEIKGAGAAYDAQALSRVPEPTDSLK